MSPDRSASVRGAWTLAAAIVAVVAFLPFARGAVEGRAFYFRDLSRQFFPLRRFAVEGLLHGEVRYWNPLLHEGVPLSLPSVSYLPDLLQLLRPNEAGFSLLLALHVPLGALFFMAMARGLGLGYPAAAGGGLVYALGGFYLSCLNLYVYVQAAAWAPLVVLGLIKAAQGCRRWQVMAAAVTAVAVSTTGAEIAAQSVAIGVLLSLDRDNGTLRRQLGRAAWSIVLGFGLAAPTILVLRNLVEDSARGNGFPTDVVLAQSIHPLALPQVVIGNWLGDLSNLTNSWWGSNFFPLGFPYILSLYLGPTVLSLAAVGALYGGRFRRRLLVLLIAAVAASLGRWAHLGGLVDLVPALHAFRHPSKLFFTAHFAVAALVAVGSERLGERESSSPWRGLAVIALPSGIALAALPWLHVVASRGVRWFLQGFLPPAYDPAARQTIGQLMAHDGATGGLLAVAGGIVALGVVSGRMRRGWALASVLAIVAADLIRAGAGINPMVTASFYGLSPEMAGETARIRSAGGRVFSCDPESGPAYFEGRRAHPDDHDVWTFAVFMETLTPAYNMIVGQPTAYSRDLTMLVSESRVLDPEDVGSSAFPRVAERLRQAGVAHVICLEPLAHPSLRLRAAVGPDRIFPLIVRTYDLADALPLRFVAGTVRPEKESADSVSRGPTEVAVEAAPEPVGGALGRVVSIRESPDQIDLVAEADRTTVVVIRDAFADGWSASVNGASVPILRADGRHRAVPIGAGTSRVTLRYAAPGLRAGLMVALLAAALLIATAREKPMARHRPRPGASL